MFGWTTWRPVTTLLVALVSALSLTVGALNAPTAAATDPATAKILNPTGGTNEDDGLRVLYLNGGFQVCYRKAQQFYPPALANPTACEAETFTNADNFFYIAVPGSEGSSDPLRPANAATAVLTNGGTRVTDTLYLTLNNVRYTADIAIDYTSPNLTVDVTGTLRAAEIVGEGGVLPEQVYFYWGADTALGGNDFGKGYELMRGSTLEVGTSNDTADGLTEWIRRTSGAPWTGYFSGYYEQQFVAPFRGNQYTGVDTNRVDTGFGWNITADPSSATQFGFKFGLNDGPPAPATIDLPSAPRNVTAVVVGGDLVVTWDPPETDGGAPVTSYSLLANSGDNYYTCAVNDPFPTPLGCTIEGVAAGAYDVKVNASNEVGDGPDGTASTGVPLPSAPTDLAATPGYANATIAFTPPASGGPFTGYQYTLDPLSAEPTWIDIDQPVPGSPIEITGLTNGVSYQIALRAINAEGPGDASEPVTVMPLGGLFVPIDPVRAYDSRTSGGALVGGQSRVVPLAQVAELPETAVAVAYNLTVVGMKGSGYLTVAPGDVRTAPRASTINYSAIGQQWANGFVSGVSAAGEIKVFAGGAATEFVVDVTGYYFAESGEVSTSALAEPKASVFVPMNPVRAYDSRDVGAGGPLGTGAPRRVNVTAAGLVPPEATAVAYTLTQTGTVGRGYLAVAPAGSPQPAVSSINWFQSNQTTANSSVVGVVNGQVDVYAGSSTGGNSQFVIDVLGFYVPYTEAPSAGRFSALDPVRAYDSRVDDPSGPIAGGQVFSNSLSVNGVPEEAVAVAFNLTETGTTGSGYLTVTPGFLGSPPVASTINWWRANQTIANGTVVAVAGKSTGAMKYSPTSVNTFAGGGSTQYIMDVAGYFHYGIG